jgi:6-phosphofructokinase
MERPHRLIALYSGVAGGADAILVPEIPLDIDIVERLRLGGIGAQVCASRSVAIGKETIGCVGTPAAWQRDFDLLLTARPSA